MKLSIYSIILLAFTACLQDTAAADTTPILTYLRPIQEIELASAESGVVSVVLVKPGDQVKKGQEILKLNTSVIEAQLAQSEAQAKHEGRLKAAEAEHAMVKQRLSIIQTLQARGSTNEAELDKAAANLIVAEGQLKAVKEELDTKQFETATIKAQLEQRILRSPIDGIVTEVTRDVGESVDARRAEIPEYLAKIVDLSQLIARVHIPANLALKLTLGQKLKVTLDNNAKTAGEGSIRFISPTVDAATGLAEVHLIFENAKGELKSGISATLLVPSS